jgi:phosphohistidine phosphatase
LTAKTVYLLRHGKSDWGTLAAEDAERPLSPRGRKAARLMGRYLSGLDQRPDRVISSPARRARETADLAMRSGAWSCPRDLDDRLYASSPPAVLEVIRACPDAIGRLLLTGHEPTWSELVALLSGGSRVKFPTAALARIDLAVDRWSEARPGIGTLIWLIPPRVLAGAR